MIKKVIDNRGNFKSDICDAVIEISSSIILNEEDRVVKGFEAESVEYIFSYAQKYKEPVIVYLYDLNSKPLK
jgi:hypothetical protein